MQAPTALSGNWSDALAAEHKMTLASFDKLEKTTPKQTTRRTMLLMHIKHSLAKHAFQEENVVYPSLRDHGAAEAADHLNSEHGYVKQYLFDLHMMPKDDRAWMTKIREFRSMLEQHKIGRATRRERVCKYV